MTPIRALRAGTARKGGRASTGGLKVRSVGGGGGEGALMEQLRAQLQLERGHAGVIASGNNSTEEKPPGGESSVTKKMSEESLKEVEYSSRQNGGAVLLVNVFVKLSSPAPTRDRALILYRLLVWLSL
jgi:hypothetical protein